MRHEAEPVDALHTLIARARAPVFFTGAGISTASGIDDFRSPGGVWSRMKPIEFADFLADEQVRLEDWRRRFRFAREFARATPNVAHRLIAARGGRVVTQNIDGLHARAGTRGADLAELHGSGLSASCLNCGVPRDLDDLEAGIDATGRAPVCERCGGIVKADVVSFGQPMPAETLEKAARWCGETDLLVAIGSSLVVNPAARLPLVAKRAGASFVIINREPTPLDAYADLVVRGDMTPLFETLERLQASSV